MVWKSGSGERFFHQCRALNLSETGVAVGCPEAIPPSSNVVLWAKDFQVAGLAQVRHCTWQRTAMGHRMSARKIFINNFVTRLLFVLGSGCLFVVFWALAHRSEF
jgi:hypothetical protein